MVDVPLQALRLVERLHDTLPVMSPDVDIIIDRLRVRLRHVSGERHELREHVKHLEQDNERLCGQLAKQARSGRLADVLGDVVRDLQRGQSPEATLQAITHAAVETVAGAEHAGVTLVAARREVQTVAATDPVVEFIDRAQYATGQGPCLQALWEEPVVRMSDLAVEARWPGWTARTRGHGVRSMCCFRLFVAEDRLGALNLYAADPDAFDEDAVDAGRLLATHAAVALASARKTQQLEQAVSSRDVIGQAKGILMELHRIDADAAFQMLVHASQRSQLKLVEVARRLAYTGESGSPALSGPPVAHDLLPDGTPLTAAADVARPRATAGG